MERALLSIYYRRSCVRCTSRLPLCTKRSFASSSYELSRRMQEEADTATLAFLLCRRAGQIRSLDDILEVPVSEQKALIQRLCHKQVYTLFETIYKAHNMPDTHNIEHSGHLCSKSAVETELKRLNNYFLDTLGFCLEIKASGIDNEHAGDGIFVQGKVKAGTVVAIYPGVVYLPYQMKRIHDQHFRELASPGLSQEAEEYENLFGDESNPNMYKVQRYDGTVINAARICSARNNLFALGHKINHPPPETKPNVMNCPYDFPRIDDNSLLDIENERLDHFQEFIMKVMHFFTRKGTSSLEPRMTSKLAEFIPNKYWEEPSIFTRIEEDVQVRSLVIVALRDLDHGEELFLNYRFNPALSNLPSWYTPVDINEDNRRWAL